MRVSMTSSRVMRPVTTVSAMSAPSWDAGPPECAISMWLLLVMKVRRTSSRGASSLTCATLRPLQAMNLNLNWSNGFQSELDLKSSQCCTMSAPLEPGVSTTGAGRSIQAEIVTQKKQGISGR